MALCNGVVWMLVDASQLQDALDLSSSSQMATEVSWFVYMQGRGAEDTRGAYNLTTSPRPKRVFTHSKANTAADAAAVPLSR